MASDPNALVEKALDVKTFSVLDAIKGRSYPTDEVTVYYDTAALYRLKGLENQRLALDMAANNAPKGEEANKFDAQIAEVDAKIAELTKQVQASAITFHMRGYSPAVRDSLVDEARAKFDVEKVEDGTPANEWLNARAVAETIIRSTDASGAVDEHHFSVEDVEDLRSFLAPEEFGKLLGQTLLLSYTAFSFDAATSPDFS